MTCTATPIRHLYVNGWMIGWNGWTIGWNGWMVGWNGWMMVLTAIWQEDVPAIIAKREETEELTSEGMKDVSAPTIPVNGSVKWINPQCQMDKWVINGCIKVINGWINVSNGWFT